MEGLEVDRSLYDIGESDLKDLWASDSFETVSSSNVAHLYGICGEFRNGYSGQLSDQPYAHKLSQQSWTPMVDMSSESDWSHILDNPIILHDRMMSDAVQSPRIQSEHSYSLTSSDEGPDSPLSITPHIKIEDMESECFPAVPVSTATGQSDLAGVVVKQEPLSPPPASRPLSPPLAAQSPPPRKAKLLASAVAQHQQSLLKQPTIVLAARPERHLLFPKVNIKVEPSSGFALPPTPPSSHGSDSDGSLSPVHSNPSPTSFADTPSTSSGHGSTFSQQSSSTSSSGSASHHHSSSTSSSMSRRSQSHSRVAVTSSSSSSSSRGSTGNGGSQLISNQAKGATGVLLLTEEEKRTLLAEGYPIPQRLPLTKAEERSLKKIRRKIKNKISAQESRRKKKEYMDSLEKKVETLTSENQEYKKRLELLENNNRTLMSQLQRLQVLLGETPNKGNRSVPTQSTTVHMDLETDDEPVDII